MYLLCAQRLPFMGSIKRITDSVMKEEPPEIPDEEFSQAIRDLIKDMLKKNPKERPSIREILTR